MIRYLQCSPWHPTHPNAVSLKQRETQVAEMKAPSRPRFSRIKSAWAKLIHQEGTLQKYLQPPLSNLSPWPQIRDKLPAEFKALLCVPKGNWAFTEITWKYKCSKLTTFLFIIVKGKAEYRRLKVMLKVSLHWNSVNQYLARACLHTAKWLSINVCEFPLHFHSKPWTFIHRETHSPICCIVISLCRQALKPWQTLVYLCLLWIADWWEAGHRTGRKSAGLWMAPSSMYTAPIDKGIHKSDYTAPDSLAWPGASARRFHLGPSVKDRHLETVRKALKRRDTCSSLTDIALHTAAGSRFCLKSQITLIYGHWRPHFPSGSWLEIPWYNHRLCNEVTN